jgi:SAM-dependent methyltransferase
VVGVDNESGAISYAQARLEEEEPPTKERLKFQLADARALPFPDRSFDTVLMGELIEHQVDPRPLLDEALRVTRPGGLVVITTPYGIFRYPDHKEPIYLTTILSMVPAGLVLEHIERIERWIGVVARASRRKSAVDLPLVLRALEISEHHLAEVDAQLEERRDTLKATQRNLQEARAARDAEIARVHELEFSLRGAERERELAHERFEERISELEGLRRELAEAREAHHQAEIVAREQLARLEAEQSRANREQSRMNREVAIRDETITELRRSIEALEAEVRERTADLPGMLRPIEAELREAHESLQAELRETRNSLQERDSARNAELERIRERSAELEREKATADAERDAAQEEVRALREELAETTRQVESSGEELSSLRGELSTLRQQLEAAEGQVAQASSAAALRETELESQLEAVRAELAVRETELGQVRERLLEYELNGTVQSARLEDLDAARRRAEEQAEVDARRLSEEIERLTESLRSERGRARDLEAELERAVPRS